MLPLILHTNTCFRTMDQTWFLCLPSRSNFCQEWNNLPRDNEIHKKLSLKKSHEELYQILISNTMTSIYVQCTVSDLSQPWEKRIGQGVWLAWMSAESLLEFPLNAGNMAELGAIWWSIRYHSLALLYSDHCQEAFNSRPPCAILDLS